MYCSQCGAPVPESAVYCPSCGRALSASTPLSTAAAITAVPSAPAATWSTPIAVETPAARYAGFWRRFWAFLIDGTILSLALWPVRLALGAPFCFSADSIEDFSREELVSKLGVVVIANTINMLVSWIYFALFHSSARQASPGMMALGMRVTDAAGQRISFARASARYFGSLVSTMTLGIGFLMMLFTERKQTLHDLMAGTVVRR